MPAAQRPKNAMPASAGDHSLDSAVSMAIPAMPFGIPFLAAVRSVDTSCRNQGRPGYSQNRARPGQEPERGIPLAGTLYNAC